jgi:hypothetical protein
MGKKDLIEILGIYIHPRAEWGRIKKIPSFSSGRFLKGVLFFSAISPISKFVGDLLTGSIRRPFYGLSWNVLTDYLFHSFVSYIFSISLAFLAVATVSMAAKLFFSEKNVQSTRILVFYSFIPYWVSGIFYLIPGIGGLLLKIVLGLYTFYVLFLGFDSGLLTVPRNKIHKYFLFCSSVLIVIFAIIEILKLTFLFM